MPLVLAVVEDLSQFAFEALRGFFSTKKRKAPFIEEVIPLAAPQTPVVLLEAPHQGEEKAKIPTPTLQMPERVAKIEKNTVMYTASIAAPLRSTPQATGDATIAVLPYGSMVMVLKVEGSWAYVACGPHEGWVFNEDLEDRAAHVYPALHIGEENHPDDPATIRLRAIIQDEFGAGELGLPLQAEEYVLYRLIKRGIKIAWPPVRPRSPGSWATILRGKEGVKIGVLPLPHSIMEITFPPSPDDRPAGHLAYVEAVFPDGAIQLSEANWPQAGIYNERVLVKSEWQDLSPVFLSF